MVAIDPAVSTSEGADETGILVAGRDATGHGFVLADASGRYAPTEWARVAIGAYGTHQADRIVAEINNGGDMVEATLRMVDPNVPFSAVRATRGKVARAEPVTALYEQGLIHHLGAFPQLARGCRRRGGRRRLPRGRHSLEGDGGAAEGLGAAPDPPGHAPREEGACRGEVSYLGPKGAS